VGGGEGGELGRGKGDPSIGKRRKRKGRGASIIFSLTSNRGGKGEKEGNQKRGNEGGGLPLPGGAPAPLQFITLLKSGEERGREWR